MNRGCLACQVLNNGVFHCKYGNAWRVCVSVPTTMKRWYTHMHNQCDLTYSDCVFVQVSGLDPFSYWLSNFLWDLVNYTVPILCIFMLFAIKDVQAYIGERFPITLVIFFLYAVSIIPLVYCFSFLFKNPSIAFIACTIFNIATGLALMVTVMILMLIEPSTADTLKNVFVILPNFCFGQALTELYNQYEQYKMWEETKFSPLFCEFGDACPSNNYWGWDDGVGKYLVAMTVECILFATFVILIEKRVVEHARSLLAQALSKHGKTDSAVYENSEPADEDVVSERRRVRELCKNPSMADDVVLVSDLKKDYHTSLFKKPKRAVNGVSVGIAHNECFGLLGVNGAGKTTTFKILTGDENLTDGHAFLKGASHFHAVMIHMGEGLLGSGLLIVNQLIYCSECVETCKLLAPRRLYQKCFLPMCTHAAVPRALPFW